MEPCLSTMIRCVEVLASDGQDTPRQLVFKGCIEEPQGAIDVVVKVLNFTAEGLDRMLEDIVQVESSVEVHKIMPVNGGWWVVMDCCDCSVGDAIALVQTITEGEMKAVAVGVLEALSEWHVHQMGHGNLKPNNILISDGQVLLGDQGMADLSVDPHPARVCPEGDDASTLPPADVWALGLSLIEMVDKVPPFYSLSDEEIAQRVQGGAMPEITSRGFARSPQMDDFIKQCLERSPERRQTIEDLRDHPWLEGVEAHFEQSLESIADKVATVMKEWEAVNGMVVPMVRIRKMFQEQLAASVRSMSSSVDTSVFEPVVLPEVPAVGHTQLPPAIMPAKAREPTVFQGKQGGTHWLSKPDPSATPEDHIIADVKGAEVYLLGPNLNVDVHSVHGSHIFIGPCKGRVRLQNLVDVHISVAAKRVELSRCQGIVFDALYSQEPVVMSECDAGSFTLTPWHWRYPHQAALMKMSGLDPYTNRWNELETADADDPYAGGLQLLADPHKLFAETTLPVEGPQDGPGEQAVYLRRPLAAPVLPEDEHCVLVKDRRQVKVVKRPGEWTGGSVKLDGNDRCEFFFLDRLKAVELSNLKFCLVVLGPADTVFAKALEGCVVVSACKDIKIVGCSESCMFLWTEGQPVVAGCSELDIGEFNVSWPLLDKQVAQAGFAGKPNRFEDIVDANPSAASDASVLGEIAVRRVDVLGADGASIGPIPQAPFGDPTSGIAGDAVPDYPPILPDERVAALRASSTTLTTTHPRVQLPALTPLAAAGPDPPAGATVHGVTSARIVKHDAPPGDVLLEAVTDSEVFLLAPIDQAVVRLVAGSQVVLGPSKGRVLIENCKNSTIIAAAGQVVVRGCVDCRLHLWCAHDFVLHSSSVTVLPWNVVYPRLHAHAVAAFGDALLKLPSRHAKVFDFSKNDARFPEPHCTMYSASDVACEVITVDGVAGAAEQFPFLPVPTGPAATAPAAAPVTAAPAPADAESASAAGAGVESQSDSHNVPETPSDGVIKVMSPNEVSHVADERIERGLGALKGGDFEGDHMRDCTVLIADVSDSVTLADCTDCVFVLGPSRGTVLLRNLTRCKVWCVGSGVRLVNVNDCRLHVFTTTPIKASRSTGTTVSPFNARIPNLPKLFMRARLHDEENVFAATSGIDDSCEVSHPEYRGLLQMQNFKLLTSLMDEPCAPDYVEAVLDAPAAPAADAPAPTEAAGAAAADDDGTPLHRRAVEQALRAEPLVGPWDVPGTAMPTKKKWEKSEVTATSVSYFRGKTVVVPASDAKKKQQVELTQLHACRVVVLGPCGNYMVDDCTDCEFVLGPCSGSLFIRDCENLCVTAVCQQLRLRDLKNVEFFIHVETDPCVESSSRIVLHPLNIRLPRLTEAFEEANLKAHENRFRHAADFNRFVDADLDDGFAIPPYVGVLKMRTTDLAGHGELDAPAALEEILLGTCEGGESLEKGTFAMGTQGVDAKTAAEEHAKREAEREEAEGEEIEEEVEDEHESAVTSESGPASAAKPEPVPVPQPVEVPKPEALPAELPTTPPAVSAAAVKEAMSTKDLLLKLSVQPIAAPRSMSANTKLRFESAMKNANAELERIKNEWAEIERLESKVDALLSKMGLQ